MIKVVKKKKCFVQINFLTEDWRTLKSKEKKRHKFAKDSDKIKFRIDKNYRLFKDPSVSHSLKFSHPGSKIFLTKRVGFEDMREWTTLWA